MASIRRRTDRILTTHVGSLPRPHDLLDLMAARLSGSRYDKAAYDERVRRAVAQCVSKQAECGIDIVTDGEQSKPGFANYVQERLEGFEPRPDLGQQKFQAEIAAFPEYYEDYFKRAMGGGSVGRMTTMACTGPVRYRGETQLREDIDNLKAAVEAAACEAAFMPAVAPSGVGVNEHYASEEAFYHSVGEALRVEYKAIADAGFMVQVDDPYLTDVFVNPGLDAKQQAKRANLHVETINEALRGIPPEQVRYHTCYGINEGPRIHEAPLSDVAGYMLAINAAYYSFEAANPRHEHEYHLWESVKLPEGKVLMPGVITHSSNIVEHPEFIAERLIRFAKLVGRENVIASADCGFASQASYVSEVHPTVIWAKFKAMREGADIATKALWS
jgi:5-methyltetrahydropteroyltriglutamate--homocysteine methyltransferase